MTVIGAAGFVGTRLVESLVLDGQTNVRAIVRAYRSLASLSRFGPAITVKLADAEDPASLVPALRGSSVVVNLTTGAPAGIPRTTKAIFKACVAAGVRRLIHLSSAVVYGEVGSAFIDDDAPPNSRHWMPYARAKSAAEIWLRQQMATAPCQVAVLRPGIVWGVRSPHTMNAVKALLDKSAYLVDNGAGIFNAIYIDNLVACIRACAAHSSDVTGFYNVADEEVVTWRDFYAALADPLDYDMRQIRDVSGDHFPWSARGLLDYVQSLSLVNSLYPRLKSRLPDSLKSRIKATLGGPYNYEGMASSYVIKPGVDRELWHLQKVRYKLPTAKFARHFGFTPPVPFEEGICRALSWLSFLGCEVRRAVLTNDR
jgi:nucleoside-diphosphate-sugar epimerase